MDQVSLDKLSVRELRLLAKERYGLTIPAAASEEMIRSAIGEVAEKAAAKCAPGFTRIVISKQPVKGGDRDVPVTVNAVTYLLKRGVEIQAPPEVVEALRNAVETRYERRTDEQGRVEMVAYEAQSYPFSILGAH